MLVARAPIRRPKIVLGGIEHFPRPIALAQQEAPKEEDFGFLDVVISTLGIMAGVFFIERGSLPGMAAVGGLSTALHIVRGNGKTAFWSAIATGAAMIGFSVLKKIQFTLFPEKLIDEIINRAEGDVAQAAVLALEAARLAAKVEAKQGRFFSPPEAASVEKIIADLSPEVAKRLVQSKRNLNSAIKKFQEVTCPAFKEERKAEGEK